MFGSWSSWRSAGGVNQIASKVSYPIECTSLRSLILDIFSTVYLLQTDFLSVFQRCALFIGLQIQAGLLHILHTKSVLLFLFWRFLLQQRSVYLVLVVGYSKCGAMTTCSGLFTQANPWLFNKYCPTVISVEPLCRVEQYSNVPLVMYCNFVFD